VLGKKTTIPQAKNENNDSECHYGFPLGPEVTKKISIRPKSSPPMTTPGMLIIPPPRTAAAKTLRKGSSGNIDKERPEIGHFCHIFQ
jgi:hypothetical protein